MISLLLFEMLAAINFNDQFRLETHKVRNVSANLYLTPEFETTTPAAAELSPELSLGYGFAGDASVVRLA